MFQSYNTVILNSTTDNLSGLAKIQATKAGVAVTSPATDGDTLRVLRVGDFKKANISAVYKNPYSAGTKSSAAITIPTLTSGGVYRLNLYIRLSGSNNSYYANDFVLKGKPFVYEFIATGTAADDAAKLVAAIKNIDKFYGIKWFNASASGAVVTIQCLDTLQLITKANLEVLTDGAKSESGLATSDILTNAFYSNVASATVSITPNVAEFGTYAQMIKDVKLPTIENFRWESQDADELPIPGEHYTQYIIEYVVDRGLFGGAAVGQQVTSKTEHIFYAATAVATAMDAALAAIDLTPSTDASPLTNASHNNSVENRPNTFKNKVGDGVKD